MNFIFIHIPRNGGSAITKVLRPFGQACSFDNHVPANQTINRIGREKFYDSFTFSAVRNPFDRLVSLYRYIRRDTAHHLHKVICQYNDFHEFVLSLPNQQNCLRDTQCSYLYGIMDVRLVNFVARFENLEEDFDYICDQIDVRVSLPKKPKIPWYKDWYGKEDIEITTDVFKKDLETFDYEF